MRKCLPLIQIIYFLSIRWVHAEAGNIEARSIYSEDGSTHVISMTNRLASAKDGFPRVEISKATNTSGAGFQSQFVLSIGLRRETTVQEPNSSTMVTNRAGNVYQLNAILHYRMSDDFNYGQRITVRENASAHGPAFRGLAVPTSSPFLRLFDITAPLSPREQAEALKRPERTPWVPITASSINDPERTHEAQGFLIFSIGH
jgi:hypothetical protein